MHENPEHDCWLSFPADLTVSLLHKIITIVISDNYCMYYCLIWFIPSHIMCCGFASYCWRSAKRFTRRSYLCFTLVLHYTTVQPFTACMFLDHRSLTECGATGEWFFCMFNQQLRRSSSLFVWLQFSRRLFSSVGIKTTQAHKKNKNRADPICAVQHVLGFDNIN